MTRSRPAHLFKIAWYRSWIIRVALVCILLLGIGFCLNFYFSLKSFDAVTNISFSDEFEMSLDEQLDEYKKLRTYYRKLILDQVTMQTMTHIPKTKNDVNNILKKIQIHRYFDPENMIVRDAMIRGRNVQWVNGDTIKIFSFSAKLGNMHIKEKYSRLESVKRRRKIIALKLKEDIKPSLILSHTIVILVCLILIVIAFIYSARQYKSRTDELITGLQLWSNDEDDFRFHGDWPAELGLIARNFNHMADEVHRNRQKSLYLEKMASWQTIARKLAHEIKNPLTPIKMLINQLNRSYKGDDTKFQTLLNSSHDIINSEIESLKTLVDSFSKFAKLPQPVFKLNDLVKTATQTIELYRSAYPDVKFELNNHLENHNYVFDSNLLAQVLKNLIKNAAEAQKTDNQIVVDLSLDKKTLCVHVIDSGPGIPEDIQKNVFEAYFTTKHTGDTHGMGLGLAICRKIAMDHQGKISFFSKPGKTIFKLSFPNHLESTETTSTKHKEETLS